MQEEFREFDIGGRNFRVSRVPATVGSRILSVLLSSAFKLQDNDTESASENKEFEALSPEVKAETAVASMWIAAGATLPEEAYSLIQRQCLQVCAFYPNGASSPIPLVSTNGRWADKDLEKDVVIVSELITKILQFNLSPFFVASALKQAEAAARVTS